MKLLFEVDQQELRRVDNEKPVNKSQNYLLATFNFLSEDWENFEKIAIFTIDNKNYKLSLGFGDTSTCIVPWEVLTAKQFFVSVYAAGAKLITTNRVSVYLLRAGYVDKADSTSDPSEDIFATIRNELDTKIDRAVNDGGIFKLYARDVLVASIESATKEYVDLQISGALHDWELDAETGDIIITIKETEE